MTHLAIVQVDDAGNAATWGTAVTADEYAAAPAIEALSAVAGKAQLAVTVPV